VGLFIDEEENDKTGPSDPDKEGEMMKLSFYMRYTALVFLTMTFAPASASPKLETPKRICENLLNGSKVESQLILGWIRVPEATKYRLNVQRGERYEHYSHSFPTVDSDIVSTNDNNTNGHTVYRVPVTVSEEGIYWFRVRALEKGEFETGDWSDPLPITYSKTLAPNAGTYKELRLSVRDEDFVFDRVIATTEGRTYELTPDYEPNGKLRGWYAPAPTLNQFEQFKPVTVEIWGSGGYEKFMYYAMTSGWGMSCSSFGSLWDNWD